MVGRARGHEILVSSPQLQAQLNGDAAGTMPVGGRRQPVRGFRVPY